MTDRVSGFVVILDRDIREDDAQATLAAIRQIRGVLDVQPVIADDLIAMTARQRVMMDLYNKITDVLRASMNG